MDITIKGLPAELKNRIREAGLFRYTPAYYSMFTTVLTLGLFLAFSALAYVEVAWHAILAGLLLSVVLGQFGFLAHDITHKQVCQSRSITIVLGEIVWGLVLGMSMIWWENDHNEHHQETNKIKRDTQINEQFVFSPEQLPYISNFQRKYILPIQHYLFFPICALMYNAIVVDSFLFVVRSLVSGPFRFRILVEYILILFHFFLIFGFIFWGLGFVNGLIVILTIHFASGFLMGLAFAPNHKGEHIVKEDEEVTFMTQILSTRNIEPSLFNDFILGSLNYQIEHHLFPKLPRPLLPKARRIIKQYCKEHHIDYHETTLVGSYMEILTSLKENAEYAKHSGAVTKS